jgi:hypothetical protein
MYHLIPWYMWLDGLATSGRGHGNRPLYETGGVLTAYWKERFGIGFSRNSCAPGAIVSLS